MALQSGGKDRTAGRIGLHGSGCAGADGPARPGGARRRRNSCPDQKRRCTAGSCGHRQAAAGGQAEGPGLAPGAQHHRADAGTSQDVFPNSQEVGHITHPDQKKAVRWKSHLTEAGTVGLSDLLHRHRIQAPDNGLSRRRRRRQPQSESIGGYRVSGRCGVDIMQKTLCRLEGWRTV